jgi:HAD superfamily hydrolase (TIGR01509 family)
MKFQAAIFDMDGLLLDSERIYGAAWADTAREMSIPLTQEMIHATIGMNAKVSEQYMKGCLGEDFDFHTFHEAARHLTYRRLEEEGIPLKPYAAEILQWLTSGGWRLALATSTREHVARHLLKSRGLIGYFDTLCFGSQVERGKPYPDIFLLAARRLGVKPEECVVLEDSPNGIAAAHAAGMTSLWIPDQITPQERPDTAQTADYLFASLEEAGQWLLQEGGRQP